MTETETRDPLDLLSEQFLHRVRKGEAITAEEFAAGHPEHSAALRELLPTLLLLEQAKRDRESSGTGARLASVPTLERLGEFRIVREVGRGGMGVVFEAVQESLGRKVALKVLPQASLLSGHQLERFRREAQTAARLHHTHIVPVFDSGEDRGYHFYAMQFIDGQGLDALVRQLRVEARTRAAEAAGEAAVSEFAADRQRCRFAARIGAEVAQALQHAHEQGTLHRDIKPANLLLDRQDHVWVTDFGLAKALQNEGLTHSGDVLGTLQYMAPEQFDGRYDARSEVYALALSLYELIALRPAFGADNRAELIDRIRAGRRERIGRCCPVVPRDLATILERALAVDPAARYATAAELADDLQAFLADRPIAAKRQSPRELLVRWCSRNRALAATGALALFAVVMAAVSGWSAYLIKNDALERTQRSARDARVAGELAAGNLELALQAFEDVFDSLVGPDPLHALVADPDPEAESGDENGAEAVLALRAPVDADDLALLQRMLAFYDRFAEKNVASPGLAGETARAYRRVGSIQAALGDYEAAADAYGKAIDRYRVTSDRDVTRDLAAVLQELGQVQVRLDRRGDAGESFEQSLAVLEGDQADTGRSARLLLARGHYLAGTVHVLRPRPMGGGPGGPNAPGRGRSGRGNWPAPGADPRGDPRDGRGRAGRTPPDATPGEGAPEREGRRHRFAEFERSLAAGREHFAQARELLVALLAEQPDDAEARFLLARCLLQEAHVTRNRGTAELRDRGLQMLTELVAEQPLRDEYRFELCEQLLPGDGGRRPPPDAAAGEQMLDAVIEHARVLVRQQPMHPEYRAVLARGLSRRGGYRAPKAPASAVADLEEAVAIDVSLIAQSKETRFLEQLFDSRRRLARAYLRLDRRDEAREQLGQALELAISRVGAGVYLRLALRGGREEDRLDLRSMATTLDLGDRLRELLELLDRERRR